MRLPFASIVFAIAAGGAATVSAQDDSRPLSLRRPPVEIGGAIEAFGVISPDGGGTIPSVMARVTVPLAGRFALDTSIQVPEHEEGSFYGVYAVQVRVRLRRTSDASTQVFATYGGLGFYEHTRAEEYRYRGANGIEQVYSSPSHTMVTLPLLPTAGIGVTQRFAKNLAWRADGGVFGWPYPAFIGFRLSVGVVVPIGGAR